MIRREMKIKGIDHIDIAVKDVEETIKIFQQMGFELVRRTTHRLGAAELQLPGPNQPIYEIHPPTTHHLDGNPGITHISFLVDNTQETFDELKGKGFNFSHDRVLFEPQTGRTLAIVEDRDRFAIHFQEAERKPFTTEPTS